MPKLRRPVPDISADVDRLLRCVIESRARFSILQVGAFDGVTNDPVHDLARAYDQVRAVLLEPQAEPFAELQARWRESPRVVPLRSALARTSGEQPLFVVAEPFRHLHPFAGQIASFSRAHVESECARYIWRPPAGLITSISVPTIDWRTLVARHGPFDFVTIDVEGYDGEVIQQMDLAAGAPELIQYEHRHVPKDMQRRSVERLENAGYVLWRINKADTLAVRAGSPAFEEAQARLGRPPA